VNLVSLPLIYQSKNVFRMSIGLFYGAGKELNIIPRSFKLS